MIRRHEYQFLEPLSLLHAHTQGVNFDYLIYAARVLYLYSSSQSRR